MELGVRVDRNNSRRSPLSATMLAPLVLLSLLALPRPLQGAQSPLLAARTHPCSRPCAPRRPMTCRYDFHVESYHSMSKACYGCPGNATDCARPDCIAADGVSRALVVVNRQLPGPSLQVCLGDRIEVTVHNHMPDQSTSVHWHGMQQRGTPYMDGVPGVTQCPVQPHSAFRYSFRADTAGTHFWHSHSGCQRADGAVGLLTVRVPRPLDPHAALYDRDLPEHGVLMWDWTHTPAASKFLAHHHAGDDNKADSVLINGKGVSRQFNNTDGTTSFTPREIFAVKQGLRYRFRIVNAGFLNCPLELSVDNHTLLVVASDGADVKPVRVNSLVSYAGERWDVIVEASQPVANYWMRVHGLLDCGPKRAHEAAVLRYEGADPGQDPAGPAPSYDVFTGTKGLQVNPLNRGSSDEDTVTAAELQTLDPAEDRDPALRADADVQLFVSYDFYAVDNPHIHRAGVYGINQVSAAPHRVFTPQLNHISLSLPGFPLLSGRDRLDKSHALCNETSLRQQGRDCTQEYCECTHVVRVPLGGVLEIVLVDQGVRYDANHPFHLHGHAFRVVALEKLGKSTTVDEVQRMDAEGRLPRNLYDPPTKDTVTVPDGGYTVLRVHADNPGYWLFHCHIEFHVELGMALVVKVGEHEDMPPVPKGFPQCGDWGSNSWLGGDDEGVSELDSDMDVDVADKLASGNHIARVLEAEPASKPGTPPPASPSSTRTETTSTSTTTELTTTEMLAPVTTETVDTATALADYPATTSAEQVLQEMTTELLLLLGEEADQSTDAYDGTTAEAETEAAGTTTTTPGSDAEGAPSSTAAAGDAAAPPTSTPKPGRPVALSEFIMRVSPSSSSSGRRRAPERPEPVSSWVIADPARPDLRYNVLLDTADAAPRDAPRDSPRSAAVTADYALLSGTAPRALTPFWATLVPTVLCVIFAMP